MNDNKIEKHESYGMIGINNCNGGRQLVGSSILQDHHINLVIRKAERNYRLHEEYFFGREIIAEIEMSPAQFTEMITSPNSGHGVPCTIRYVIGEGEKQKPPMPDIVDKLKTDSQININETKEKSEILKNTILDLIKEKKITKVAGDKILSDLHMLTMHICDNMPFLVNQFERQMEKTVTEAKTQIESFITHKIYSTGIKALQEGFIEPKLLFDNVERPIPDEPQN